MSDASRQAELPEERLVDLIRTSLPRLLREHPELRHEVAGILAEAFPTRQEFAEVVAELRALREDFRRFAEETTRRFEAVDRRFEEIAQEIRELRGEMRDMQAQMRDMQGQMRDMRVEMRDMQAQVRDMRVEMRDMRLEVSALSGRLGHGLEHLVRGVIEEFAGEKFTRTERLVLTDSAGEVYGVPGALVEYDLLVSNGTAYVVEVKSHLKPDDVLTFHRKGGFASRQLGRPLKKVMIAASMEERSETLMRQLGIDFIVRSRLP